MDLVDVSERSFGRGMAERRWVMNLLSRLKTIFSLQAKPTMCLWKYQTFWDSPPPLSTTYSTFRPTQFRSFSRSGTLTGKSLETGDSDFVDTPDSPRVPKR
eukprot:312481_1